MSHRQKRNATSGVARPRFGPFRAETERGPGAPRGDPTHHWLAHFESRAGTHLAPARRVPTDQSERTSSWPQTTDRSLAGQEQSAGSPRAQRPRACRVSGRRSGDRSRRVEIDLRKREPPDAAGGVRGQLRSLSATQSEGSADSAKAQLATSPSVGRHSRLSE